MRKHITIIAAMFILIFVSACSTTSNQATGGVVELNIDSFNWGFDQDPVKIKKGDTVRLTLSASSGRHGIAIPNYDVSTPPVIEGETHVVEFVASEAGTFDYFCNVPCGQGHMNMRGQIVVEE
jgi:cytochrome c oxidase subunit 2